MYYLLSLLGGMLISVMVVFNGGLNARVGQTPALVIIHAAGLIFTGLLMLIKREKPRLIRLPLYLYSAGLIGIATTVFNNTAFGHISVSAMMALGLLGESISSLAADHFGLLGLPRRPFRPQKLWGGLLALTGIAFMWDDFKLIPVVVSLLAGVTVLVSRLINGQQSRHTGLLGSTLINYLTGLIGSLILLAFTGGAPSFSQAMGGPAYIYLGGAMGGVIILLSSFCVGKIPSFYMTLAFFVGQVFAGLLLDMALAQTFPVSSLIGGLFVLAGLTVNLMLDRAQKEQASPPALKQRG